MSRPRKPFGANQPGRLPATMMKVLAAEMSDPHRLNRGKRYAKDGSVLDIVIEPGVVTGEVQGSRSTPYIAALEVTAGDGMPLRRDVQATCTCPDIDNWDGHICKHVVATMFAFSDELLIEPELLDRWRGREPGHDDPRRAVADAEADGDVSTDAMAGGDVLEPGRRRGHLRLVTDRDTPTRDTPARDAGHDGATEPEPPDDAHPIGGLGDPLATFLAATEALPDVPDLDRIEPRLPRRPELAAVVRDAIGHLRIEWD